MKTKIFFQISAITLALLCTQSIIAQDNSSKKEKYNYYALIEAVKANPDVFSATAYGTATATVNNKISKSFEKYFGAAEQNWSIVGKNFLNRFHKDGVLTNSLFDENGHLIYTITYGQEKDMPAETRQIVKSEYYDYTITMAVNVQEGGRNIWIAFLKNASAQLTVRVEDGEMEQVQQFETTK